MITNTDHSQPSGLAAEALPKIEQHEGEDEEKREQRDERAAATPSGGARVRDLTHARNLKSRIEDYIYGSDISDIYMIYDIYMDLIYGSDPCEEPEK